MRSNAWLADDASPWADSNLPETLHQRLTSLTVRPPSEDEARDAALVICGRALDAAEARELLAMCGLLGVSRG